MAEIDTMIVELQEPESFTNSDAEVWEYMLQWFGVDAAIYQYLFTDWEKKVELNGEVINSKSTNITKLFSDVEQTVVLVAEDLDFNQFQSIANIVQSKDVFRIFTNNTSKRVAVLTDAFTFRVSDNRYNYAIEIREQQEDILK